MVAADLLLPPALRQRVADWCEPRAADVDAGRASVREGLGFLTRQVLAQHSDDGDDGAARRQRVAETLATVAWSDLSTAFSLWCHTMVLEYLALAAPGSLPRTTLLPRARRLEMIGSTAMAAAMAHVVSGAPMPLAAQQENGTLVVRGRLSWASNLFHPDFLMVTAVASADDGRAFVLAVPADARGVCVAPHPPLLALQGTASSLVELRDVRLSTEWVVAEDLHGFIRRVRPTLLLYQSSFCWGLAHRALAEARRALRGVNEVLCPDLAALEAEAARVATSIRAGLRDEGPARTTRDCVQLRLDSARLATASVALEAKAVGGRSYLQSSPTARRLREAAFLPVQTPTEGQLRWELSRCA